MSNSSFILHMKKYNQLKSQDYKMLFNMNPSSFLFYLAFVLSFIGAILCFVKIEIGILVFVFIFLYACVMSKYEDYFVEMFNKKFNVLLNLEVQIVNDVFTGSLSDLFDMNCEHTISTFKTNASLIESNIYNNKGMSGKMVLDLKKRIDDKVEYAENERKEKEEKEALQNANTTTGAMLNELKKIKDSK